MHAHLMQSLMRTLPSHQAAIMYAHMLVNSSEPHTVMVVKAKGKPTAPYTRENRPGESSSHDL